MDISGISALTKTQAAYDQQASQSSPDSGGGAGGWKYVTVQEGDIIYTYIVIGKNMRVLIGETPVKGDDKGQKTAADKNSPTGNAAKTDSSDAATPAIGPQAATGQGDDSKSAASKKGNDKIDFATDLRMFALTGYYQQKMRQTLKNMEESLGGDKVASITANPAAGKRPDQAADQ